MKTVKRETILSYYIKVRVVFIFVFSLIQIGFVLWIPILIGHAVDFLIGKGQVDFLLLSYQLMLIGIATGSAFVCEMIVNRYAQIVAYTMMKDLRMKLFHTYMTLPMSDLDALDQGELWNTIINDIDLMSEGLLQGFHQLFRNVFLIIGTFLFMLMISFPLTMIVIALTPLSLAVAAFVTHRTYRYFQVQLKLRAELSTYVEEMVSHQDIVKAFDYEERAQKQMEEINQAIYHNGLISQFLGALINPSTRLVNSLVYASLCLAGALSVLNQDMSIGILASFLSYATQYTKPFNDLSHVFNELQTAYASAKRVFRILDMPPICEEKTLPIKNKIQGHVQMKNVSFAYPHQPPVLKNIAGDVRAGQTVAIVGKTGSGKTTLMSLLMRFYEPQSGEITIDGQSIQTMKRTDLRQLYGMVLQESWLINGTVKENILYGQSATDEELKAVCQKIHIHQWIMQLKDGYDTCIQDNGKGLSEGQKQLICIARVILKKPTLLILDEATASIDTRTEKQVQDALHVMMQGRTTFIVAHRLSTIQKADHIWVMDQGCIVERGTHTELLAQEGRYAQLYAHQFNET